MVTIKYEAIADTLSNEAIEMISDALLHEMERYNQAEALVTDTTAKKAIEDARHRVYEVLQTINQFLEE